jgi:hypothetical protein
MSERGSLAVENRDCAGAEGGKQGYRLNAWTPADLQELYLYRCTTLHSPAWKTGARRVESLGRRTFVLGHAFVGIGPILRAVAVA